LVLPREDEGEKPKTGGPTKSIGRTKLMNNVQYKETTKEVNNFEL
jgi:hypothetical protein